MRFKLNIVDSKGKLYWTESFETRLALDAWLNVEKLRAYWQKTFVLTIEDNSVAVDEKRRKAKEAYDAQFVKLESSKLVLVEFLGKKTKTLPDCVLALETLIKLMGLEAPLVPPTFIK